MSVTPIDRYPKVMPHNELKSIVEAFYAQDTGFSWSSENALRFIASDVIESEGKKESVGAMKHI